ncbi:MAG TPA: T9SS type A sorting domain-containing protein [candidate division WOR-3 bacterium]|uniref:T9SS type A sorting domain-containing protein n=1 Tax=candidate division WOR-3 bacterium TaxID=2052148 RepID=A0A9C9EP74_UNCW3|nr:T9SS type A sorting domain-containing protein [candidate division WOR-3 bacterium]
MKRVLKIVGIIICLLSFSMVFATPRVVKTGSKTVSAELSNQAVPYRPASQRAGVLFVEDGSGYYPPTNPDPVWDSVLTNILGAGNYGWFGPTTDPMQDGPDLATMQGYDLVIWNNYDQWDNPTLTSNDMANIEAYINGGGKVWLIAQDLLYSGVPLSFLTTNFHVASAAEDYVEDSTLNIQGLDEIAGITLNITTDLLNVFYPDNLTPDGSAHHVVEDTDNTAYPCIMSDDATTSFWTVDGRTPVPWTNWEQIVHDMLDAFGVLGVYEVPVKKPSLQLKISITPTTLVKSSIITYNLPSDLKVNLEIFNITGQHVTTLVNGYEKSGYHSVVWNGKNASGINVPNGVYFVRLSCGESSCAEKLIVVK